LPIRSDTAEELGDAEADEVDTVKNDARLEMEFVLFFWYMLSKAGPPQNWLEFAAQVIVHEPLAGAEPEAIVSPQ